MEMNFFIFLISWLLCVSYALGERTCTGKTLNECKENETCLNRDKNTGVCECKKLYHLENDACIPNETPTTPVTSSGHAGHSAFATFAFMLMLFLGLTGSIVFFARRHHWIERLHAFRIRRYNTVFVSTSANVDDDAPIT